MICLITTNHSRVDTDVMLGIIIAKETQLSKSATQRLTDEVVIVENLKYTSNTEHQQGPV
jgi:hypothetical protein